MSFPAFLWFFIDRHGKRQIFGHEGEWGSVNVDSAYLTKEHAKDPNGIVRYKSGSYNYELNMKTMKQTNLETGVVREVEKHGLNLTLYQGNPSNSNEVQIVKQNLADCCIPEIANNQCSIRQNGTQTNINIQNIAQIINPRLYHNYERSKLRLTITNEGEVGEMLVAYHGSTEKNLISIANHGFETSPKCHRNGDWYGKGAYFASSFYLANRYSVKNNGVKRIILSQMLTGKKTRGYQGITKPPYLDEKYKDLGRYDSCVDDVEDSNIYCIFDADQVLPYLMIEYVVLSD